LKKPTLSTLLYSGLTCALMVSGCASTDDPTRFYTLRAANEVNVESSQQTSVLTNTIGIVAVTIPRLIDRPQLVMREGQHEIHRAEFHQWGGSLQEEIERVLVSGLNHHLNDYTVYLYPNKTHPRPERELALDITRLDGSLGQSVTLDLQWRMEPRINGEPPVNGHQTFTQPLDTPSHTAYVAGISDALLRACREIANALEKGK